MKSFGLNADAGGNGAPLAPMIRGADALIKELEALGVEYIFGYPGGAAINIFDSLYHSSIKLILVRHEQGATHMADGYARATGRVGVVLVTSGPGALNTVTGLLTAKMDSVPLLVLCGQTNSTNLGKDAFQEADVLGTTLSVVKYSRLILKADDIPSAVNQAFHLASLGRPGPVLLDIPKDLTSQLVRSREFCLSPESVENKVYAGSKAAPRPTDQVASNQVHKLAEILNAAERPLILVGHGALISGARKEVKELVTRLNAPAVYTLLAKGVLSDLDPHTLGMLGMHGTPSANYATTRCDVILSIGSRFDDRINGDPQDFCPLAKILHIDIDSAEIGRTLKPFAFAEGDARQVLEGLLPLLKVKQHRDWWADLHRYQMQFPLEACGTASQPNELRAVDVIQGINRWSPPEKTVVVTDVGQHQMWGAQHLQTVHPRHWLSSGGAGTMGFGFPGAIGAQLGRPDCTVVALVGDGGFQMVVGELATAKINNIPVKIMVIDNQCLGMVRQWQELFYEERYSGIDLLGNPDFVKLAEAYGIKGFYVDRLCDLDAVMEEAFAYQSGPCLIHARVMQEDNVWPMIPAGKSARHMVLKQPTKPMEQPTGST